MINCIPATLVEGKIGSRLMMVVSSGTGPPQHERRPAKNLLTEAVVFRHPPRGRDPCILTRAPTIFAVLGDNNRKLSGHPNRPLKTIPSNKTEARAAGQTGSADIFGRIYKNRVVLCEKFRYGRTLRRPATKGRCFGRRAHYHLQRRQDAPKVFFPFRHEQPNAAP